jgi:ketosteroid isomerase-like protein
VTAPVDLDRMRRAISMFYSGRINFMRALFAEDVVWRVPHSHPLAADIVGADAVLELMRRVRRETNGTFSAVPVDLAASESRVYCQLKLSAKRGDKVLDQSAVLLFHLNPEGRVRERELFLADSAAADDFWSF